MSQDPDTRPIGVILRERRSRELAAILADAPRPCDVKPSLYIGKARTFGSKKHKPPADSSGIGAG